MFDAALEQQIDSYFSSRREAIIQDIFRLVRIPSVSVAGGPADAPFGPDCARVLDEALEMAREKGVATRNFDYYAGTARWGNPDSELGLCTHLDVVPAGNDWIYSPFDPQVVDGHLVGRGVSDDKGPAVLMMYVTSCIRDLGLPMKHGIRMIMGCNEESGMADLAYYREKEPAPRFTLVPDSIYPVNNGEKGRGRIHLKSDPVPGALLHAYCGRKGNLLPDRAYALLSGVTADSLPPLPEDITAEDTPDGLRITARGIACHATKPETGKSAIKVLFSFLLSARLLQGGQQSAAQGILSILSDWNGAGLGIAYSDQQSGSVTHVMDELEFDGSVFTMGCTVICPVTMDMALLEENLGKEMEKLSFHVSSVEISPLRYISPEDPVVQALMEVYCHVHPRPFPPIVTGGTHAKMLPNALAFGNAFRESPSPFAAGHGGIHKPDECILVDDLLESAKIYVLSLLKLDEIID